MRWRALLGLAAWLPLSAIAGVLLPDMTNGTPDEFAIRRAGAEVAAAGRIEVALNNLHRLSYSNLLAAGLTNPPGSSLRLFCRTQEVALFVTTSNAMGAADYALFFAQANEGYYTATNVYWLGAGGTGLRMETRNAAPLAPAAEVTSRWRRASYGPDVLFGQFYRPTDAAIDHWGAVLVTATAEVSVTVATPDRLPGGSAEIRVRMMGVTDSSAVNPDHVTRVRVNGTTITNHSYDGAVVVTITNRGPASLLNNGNNTIGLLQTAAGVPADNAILDTIEIEYDSTNRASGGGLRFGSRPGTNNVTVYGLPASNGLWALDITDPAQPVLLTNASVTADGSAWKIRFGESSAASNAYYILATSAVSEVSTVTPTAFRDLADTNRQADYLILCPYAMRTNAYQLGRQRVKQGLSVAVAPLADVYNEFSYGIKDADAIKQFLGYAYHHWRAPAPRYAVLLGDGCYDPKNFKGATGHDDTLPVHLGPSAYEWASLDNWFGMVDGADPLADIAVGRIPVRTDAQLGDVAGKILAYEALPPTNAWRKKALLTADLYDGTSAIDFKAASEARVATNLVAGGVNVLTKAYMDDAAYNTTNKMRTAITNTINSGVLAVSYFGHGANDFQGYYSFFDTNDAAKLNNSVWPVVTAITCENGDFDDPLKECLGERLLERANRGAIAVAAAAAPSIQDAAEYFADGFYEALVNTNQYHRLGDIMSAAHLNLWSLYPTASELYFYSLLGDPGLVVNP